MVGAPTEFSVRVGGATQALSGPRPPQHAAADETKIIIF
jgi:hypothetical protein